jgi:hypothetical protein
VSSYGRNVFTRGAPCLCLVWCLLYTFAVATCRRTPHLQRRNSPRYRPGCVVPSGTSRPGPSSPCAEVFSTRGASDSSEPSVPKHSRPCLRHRRPAPLRWAAPAQQNSHNSSSISVFVKPVLQEIPRAPKPRVSRNRYPGRTWTTLPKSIFPNKPLLKFFSIWILQYIASSACHSELIKAPQFGKKSNARRAHHAPRAAPRTSPFPGDPTKRPPRAA